MADTANLLTKPEMFGVIVIANAAKQSSSQWIASLPRFLAMTEGSLING